MNIAANDLGVTLNHSKLGFVSTGLAITATIAWFFPLIISLILKNGAPAAGSENIFVLVSFISAPVLHLTGLILGVAGAFKKDSKKLFVIIGIIYNGVCLIIVVGFLLLFLLALYTISNTPWR